MGEKALDLEHYTLAEYFAFDNASDVKHEYERGAILAMSRGTMNHARIGTNITRHLGNKLEASNSPCEPFNSDARVYVSAADSSLHPDVSVFCDDIEYVDEMGEATTNPTLIFEVLSKSTSGYDRGEKFIKYRFLPSLAEYVLVDQYEKRVELFRKTAEGDWLLKTYFNTEAPIELESIGTSLTFDEIYDKVEWEVAPQ